ncbi:TM2 domain-containing protein [Shewanella sp.]|uniref:TM2 domain-containing protein n=1 Tax=Shewanella sp. TaxID=50422 RepID=UPI003A97C012
MRFWEPIEQLEAKEDALRQQVNALPEPQRKQYYAEQSKRLKDPDTYATLNWLFLGGIHHCYLGKYALFAVEFLLLVISLVLIIAGYHFLFWVIAAIAVFELPQLFYSQRIVRIYNYRLSLDILQQLGHIV